MIDNPAVKLQMKSNVAISSYSYPNTKELSIIIPAYNEENRIGQTIRELEDNIPEILEILVIFDGNDNTPKVAIDSGRKVKVIRYRERLGQGGAVFEGFRLARGNVVCFVDADGSAPWYEVKRVCLLVWGGNPVVYGSRWAEGAKIKRRESLRNVIGGRAYHYLALFLLGVKEKDSFCGLKAFRWDVASELARKITIHDRTFNMAISYNLKLMGHKPIEVGIEWSHSDGTQLPVGLKTVVMMFLTLFGLKLAHMSSSSKFRRLALEFRKMFDFY